ncbi:hypothetical protein Trydic_g13909 [Trypoxylus dichotomus]
MRTLCVLLIVVLVTVLIENSTAAECTPGEQKQVECNTCHCTPTGLWGCTRKHCVSKRATKCTPGESYKEDCNTCVCSQDGRSAACTLKFCVH